MSRTKIGKLSPKLFTHSAHESTPETDHNVAPHIPMQFPFHFKSGRFINNKALFPKISAVLKGKKPKNVLPDQWSKR